jgi:hypothetical protein
MQLHKKLSRISSSDTLLLLHWLAGLYVSVACTAAAQMAD